MATPSEVGLTDAKGRERVNSSAESETASAELGPFAGENGKTADQYVEPAPVHAFQRAIIPQNGCLRRRWNNASTKCKVCVVVSVVLSLVIVAFGITALVWYFTVFKNRAVKLPPPCTANCSKVDHSLRADVLREHTNVTSIDGVELVGVRYASIKRGPSEKLDKYLEMIGDLDFATLGSMDALALSLNAYNAWTVDLITRNAGVKSIRDIGTLWRPVWKIRFAKINAQKVTLDEVEHEVIRKRWQDARVHAAVNCASVSCPDLMQVPYNEPGLDGQLQSATIRWLSSSSKGAHAKVEENVVYLNPIMSDWYTGDFTRDSPDGSLLGWVAKYMDMIDTSIASFMRESLPRVNSMNYNWNLNIVGTWEGMKSDTASSYRALSVAMAAAVGLAL